MATSFNLSRRQFAKAASLAALATYAAPRSAFAHGEDRLSSGFVMKSKPLARKLVVFRLDDLPFDVRELRLTLHCLQGLVNRVEPRLYLIQDRYDELWLNWLHERGDIQEV